LNEFAESAAAQKIRFLDEVTTAVLRRYLRDLESKGYSAKTIDTRVNIVYFMLKKFGVKACLRLKPKSPSHSLTLT
jgi:site-specific recombinase XerD